MKYVYCVLILAFMGCASTQSKDFSNTPKEKTNEPIIVQNDVYIESQKVVRTEVPVFIVIDKNDKTVPKELVSFYMMKDTMIYNYDIATQYTVLCKPLYNTDIVLEEGEILVNDVIIGDSVRWVVSSSYNVNEKGVPIYHIYVKPLDFEISTTLTLNTNKRSYSFLLASKKDGSFNTIVKFQYPVNFNNPVVYMKDNTSSANGNTGTQAKPINYSYYMKYKNGKLAWLPKMVYDDGEKIYIVFDATIKYYTFPACYAGDKSIINYRVDQNVIIIDNLYDSILLKLEKDEIYIYKK